jgi:uncharacterized C2H2 Zn-finger protein
MSWQCFEGCDKIFDAQHSFDDHIQKAHADLAPMLPALRRTSARGADLTEQVQCSLCTKGMSLRALQKHLASHQQQLSLFALPTNLDETEDDEDEEDRRSQGMQESDDDNISNVSDTRDADESSTLKIPWRLCTREYHWSFLDDKVESSNTDQLPLIALQDQHSWTEILASWVLRKVIEEAGYRFRQVQKDDLASDGRQTYYLIDQALQYPQVRQLVEQSATFHLQKEATENTRIDDAAEKSYSDLYSELLDRFAADNLHVSTRVRQSNRLDSIAE